MQEQKTLVCAPATDSLTIRGSSFAHSCHECGQRVMVAPSGQEILREDPTIQILCVPCMNRLFKPTDTVEPPDNPERIRQELRNIVPNLWRKRN